MATWTAPLPPNDTAAGDPGHPVMHNQLVDALTEVRTNVDLNVVSADPRLSVAAAATASIRALGTAAGTAAAGNDTRFTTAAAVGTPSVRALVGGTALTASASDHKHVVADVTDLTAPKLMTGTVAAVNNVAAAPTQADFNALLAALRLRGIISGA